MTDELPIVVIDEPGEFGVSVRTKRGTRLAVRSMGSDQWVICENTIGRIERDTVHGFVRNLGGVWEVTNVGRSNERHYCAHRVQVMATFLTTFPVGIVLPVLHVEVHDRAFSADELGAEDAA